MKKSTKLKFLGRSTKAMRRELHELDRRPGPKFQMDHTVPKPTGARDKNGNLVKYDGP